MSKEKLKEYLQSISKDRVVELCLQYQFDAKIAEQQLAEKDKEIEMLKLKLDIRAMSLQNINTERIESERNQKQLAIQELEKVKDLIKHFCKIHSDEYYMVKTQVKGIELDVCESIDYQIKELKGENYEETRK